MLLQNRALMDCTPTLCQTTLELSLIIVDKQFRINRTLLIYTYFQTLLLKMTQKWLLKSKMLSESKQIMLMRHSYKKRTILKWDIFNK